MRACWTTWSFFQSWGRATSWDICTCCIDIPVFAPVCWVWWGVGRKAFARAILFSAWIEAVDFQGSHKTRSGGGECWSHFGLEQCLIRLAGSKGIALLPKICGGGWIAIPESKDSRKCDRHDVVGRSPWNEHLDVQAVGVPLKKHTKALMSTIYCWGTELRASFSQGL